MFLLNVRMQMENQGPIPTHSYGYQDAAGDIRTESHPYVPGSMTYTNQNHNGQRLIFDP